MIRGIREKTEVIMVTRPGNLPSTLPSILPPLIITSACNREIFKESVNVRKGKVLTLARKKQECVLCSWCFGL